MHLQMILFRFPSALLFCINFCHQYGKIISQQRIVINAWCHRNNVAGWIGIETVFIRKFFYCKCANCYALKQMKSNDNGDAFYHLSKSKCDTLHNFSFFCHGSPFLLLVGVDSFYFQTYWFYHFPIALRK